MLETSAFLLAATTLEEAEESDCEDEDDEDEDEDEDDEDEDEDDEDCDDDDCDDDDCDDDANDNEEALFPHPVIKVKAPIERTTLANLNKLRRFELIIENSSI